jgi:hypothetical protein
LGFGQEAQDEANLYECVPVEKNLYQGHEKAKLIVDYYNTWEISTGERYSYEILVIENILMLAFTSPETADFNEISFETKRVLSKEQIDYLIQLLNISKLKHLKNGIPEPSFSGYAKQVLIIKSENLSIGGGMFYSTIVESDTNTPIDQQVKAEEKSNSSIGGDYDFVFKALDNLFVEKKQFIT